MKRVTVRGVPIVGVPVVDLIETDLEEALDVCLWALFPEPSDRTWRPDPDPDPEP